MKDQLLTIELLERLKDYHGQDVSWHIKNKSDVHTLADELIELGDEEFINQNKTKHMRKRKCARIGTYYNGHDSKLIDKLNEVLKDVKDDTIVEELFVNYFDDQDIEGIIEFFEDRFNNEQKPIDMKENNKMIAEFMGVVFHDDENQYYNANGLHIGNKLQFHTSWDWLMPVVEKCYDNGADENEVGDITHALLDCDIDHTYKSVVEFINQYNKNK